MGKCISSKKLTDKLSLAECTDGFYIWCAVRQMNIAMHTKTAETAFVEALEYYQDRCAKQDAELKAFREKTQKIAEILGLKEDED